MDEQRNGAFNQAERTGAPQPEGNAQGSREPGGNAQGSPEPGAAASRSRPLVSICCITYNHAPYIRSALDGFLMQQTDFTYEILIHDDASTDGTALIIREYAARYPHIIKPILRQENQYQRGISNISIFNFPRAAGRYIAMCEGDDYWTDPGKLQKQVEYLKSHPDCSLCFHSSKIISVDGSRTEGLMRPYRESKRVEPEEIVDKTSGYPTASLVFPAWIVKELPGYYLDCPVGDIPMQLMMAQAGYAYYMDEPMCVYRVGVSSSWTSLMKRGDYENKQKRYCAQMGEMYRAFDRATDGRFHEQAVSAATRIYFLTQVNTKKYEQMMKPEYRRYYRELSVRTRFFIRFERLAPKVYRLLQRLVR